VLLGYIIALYLYIYLVRLASFLFFYLGLEFFPRFGFLLPTRIVWVGQLLFIIFLVVLKQVHAREKLYSENSKT
jgi:hypothetical protein